MVNAQVLRRVVLTVVVAAALVLGGAVGGTRAASAATGDGSPADSNVKYFGRWDTSSPAAYVSEWAGAYLKVGFAGTSVKLKQRGTIDFFASIDGGADVAYKNVSGTVNLTPTALAAGNHTLRVSYRPVAGSYHGDAVFQGVILDSGARTRAPVVSSKIVEFIGDSITVGQLTSKQALTAYGWLVSERLGYEHTQIAQGGACLVATADGCVGLNVQFFKTSSLATSANWDFARYQARAVVINLGTNDVGHSVSTVRFQAEYTTFLRNVRAKYPNATIFAMETFRMRYTTQTAAAVTDSGLTNVFYVNTEGWITAADTVDGVHPNETGHQKIAGRLAPIISASIGIG
jgi:lysophospholipase L1-like esterase